MKRGTLILVLFGLILFMGSGCYWAEMAMKAGARGGLEIVNKQIPILSETLKGELLKTVDAGVEKLTLAAADAGHAAGMKTMSWLVRQADLDPMDYDFDGSGAMDTEMEARAALMDAKESGKWPWYSYVIAGALGLLAEGGAGFTIMKSLSRYREAKRKKEIKAEVNGGTPAEG
jgi:hypothetical protein